MDIAIVGLSGRYPAADDLRQFWDNLKAGKSAVTEVPKSRWDHDAYFDSRKGTLGKTYGKWGGFLADVDAFDAAFFKISPREAEALDPQERLFLECAYSTIEDAGYTPRALNERGDTGVYVGVQYNEYTRFSNVGTLVAAFPASIANRVSFFCDFHGPSMGLDTMCSASLTAVHLACEGIERGDCEQAIAGGVNVSIHPHKYLLHAQGRFASSTGRCNAFGQGGDGYVPAEGVGAVLLKALARAVADGDHVYGVIKGSAINHGGRASGFTVPRSAAQAGAIARAFRRARVDPRTIGYVEAHGTGTAIGDLIEVEGLVKAFAQGASREDKQFCAIGSVKSNIGHCESAAGIAGLTKVLLQMKHGQLVPSLHSGQLNRSIHFESTPFRLQQELGEWPRPAASPDGAAPVPLRAGISSFGAGGSNAHLIVEEYVAPPGAAGRPASGRDATPVVLSAKTPEQLRLRAERLRSFLRAEEDAGREWNYLDVAYTLQVGREEMPVRLGFVARSPRELLDGLAAYLRGDSGGELYAGRAAPKGESAPSPEQAADARRATLERRYDDVLAAWVAGVPVEWASCHDGPRRRVSLPSYPFARDRHWVPTVEASSPATADALAGGADAGADHPLLHRNTSTLSRTCYTSTFTGDEFFLRDHRIHGRRVLPGVAYVEMVRAALVAGAELREPHVIRVQNLAWVRPFVAGGGPARLHLRLTRAAADGVVAFEFSGDAEAREAAAVYCRGRARATAAAGDGGLGRHDLDALRRRCAPAAASVAQYYQRFKVLGIEYGPAHRGLGALHVAPDVVLARLELPEFLRGGADRYALHPTLLDAALQASIALHDDDAASDGPAVPFMVREIAIAPGVGELQWAVLRRGAGGATRQLDLDLCGADGAVLVRIEGYLSKALKASGERGARAPSGRTVLLAPAWREAPAAAAGDASPPPAEHWVLLCELGPELAAPVARALPRARLLRLGSPGERARVDERYRSYCAALLETLQSVMAHNPASVLMQLVVPDGSDALSLAGLFGLLQSAAAEWPALTVELVQVGGPDDVVPALRQSLAAPALRSRHAGGRREVGFWAPAPTADSAAAGRATPPWRADGTYLITGASGGLGRVFANDIAAKAPGATLVLWSRTDPDAAGRRHLAELASRANVVHDRVDVTDRRGVADAMGRLASASRRLTGVLHAAGVKHDRSLRAKSAAEMDAVLAPKVTGVCNLDEATADSELELFVLFSSIAGALGNAGQADYAAANAFMDAFARRRNELARGGRRRGHAISINWPLWQDGGMRLDARAVERIELGTGMLPLRSESGLDALYRGLRERREQLMVLEGHADRLAAFCAHLALGAPPARAAEGAPMAADAVAPAGRAAFGPAAAGPAPAGHAARGGGGASQRPLAALSRAVARVLKINEQDVDADTELSDLGFDSVTLTEFASVATAELGVELDADALMTHSTLGDIVRRLSGGGDPGPAAARGDGSAAADRGREMAKPPHGAAENEVRELLAATAAELLGVSVSDVEAGAEWSDLGVDAVGLERLRAAVGERFAVDLPSDVFQAHPTIEQLAARVASERGVAAAPESAAPPPPPPAAGAAPAARGAGPRSLLASLSDDKGAGALHCVAGGGMTPLSYAPLARALGGLGVTMLDQRALFEGGAGPRTMHEVAAVFADALVARTPRGPYLLVGHSFGGCVAFEAARRLEGAGHEVGLCMLDSPFYISEAQATAPGAAEYIGYFLREQALVSAAYESVGDEASALANLNEAARLSVRSHLGASKAASAAAAVEEIASLYARQIVLHRAYRPAGVFSGRVHLLLATESVLGGANLAGTLRHYRAYMTGPIEVATVAGGHLSLLRRENVASLAAALRARAASLFARPAPERASAAD